MRELLFETFLALVERRHTLLAVVPRGAASSPCSRLRIAAAIRHAGYQHGERSSTAFPLGLA
jgi:hypothetical protein